MFQFNKFPIPAYIRYDKKLLKSNYSIWMMQWMAWSDLNVMDNSTFQIQRISKTTNHEMAKEWSGLCVP